jgi:hypothetical protein
VVSAAQEFGRVYKDMRQENLYDLFIDDGYNVSEVLQYLESQV